MAPAFLLTRPAADSERFAGALRDRLREVRVVISPLADIRQTEPVPPLGAFAGVIFTSRNAARLAAGLAPGLPAWTVGDATAAAAASGGFAPVSAGGDADALVARMSAEAPSGRWLHLHGAETRGEVVPRLAAAGIAAEGLAIYEQVPLDPAPEAAALLSGPSPVIVPLFSPRAARRFADLLPVAAPLSFAALSANVMEALDDARDRPRGPDPHDRIAARPDAAALLEACVDLHAAVRRVEGGWGGG